MTDERTPSSENERTPGDGDVEIEITRGKIGDDGVGDSERHGTNETRDSNEHADESDTRDGHERRGPDAQDGDTDLADELGRIDIMTTPAGYVEGRITDLSTVDATTVELTVTLPHGETTAFTLEKPIPWSREFLLARLVEDVGYDAASIDYAVGEPVSLERTDLETDDDENWWAESVQVATDALVSSLSGGRYSLERTDEPEWRLVDPLERPDPTGDTDDETVGDLAGAGLVLIGTVLAVTGGVVGATGGLVVSGPIVAYASIGLIVVLAGLIVLFRDELREPSDDNQGA
ncbi:hypothetical protein D8Y22_08325 [Salinadaptatus halalkaliphilus]|uniref:Uncharacterized protein n=1 Tax=Salinadaptatus halalkaliphilus TaxID=2419781 RepID=A0A4S3TLZ7_9EURY|nr:hypothetical protein [Salinadaptatus halalkaliphilus]THE65209.1 hypothetical protein D8Y22_08325 [Salinadaptatus halalkaliphilus]